MDTIRIREEMPEEYALLRRRREERSARIRKTINYILIFCMVLLLLFGCYSWLSWRIEARSMLGQAKSVELAIHLTAIQYYGIGSTPYDSGSASGLKKAAEEEVMKYAEVDGRVRVLGWEEEANGPTAFLYQRGKMVVLYRLGEDGNPDWKVYRMQDILSAE